MARDAADSANSRSSCGSTLWNEGCGGGGLGTAMSSVSSRTSMSSSEGRISSAEVDSSRPDNNASQSSWLFDAAGAGGGATGVGTGAGAATFVAAATAAGIFDGGMSAITAGLATGATAAGLSGFTGAGAGAAAGLAGFSATGGFASSSAMMRRIDARISSIEGSWTFAGCVISDSTSSTPFARVVPNQAYGICQYRIRRPACSLRKPDLFPVQAPRRSPPRVPAPQCIEASRPMDAGERANRQVAQRKAMSWQQMIASKALMRNAG